MFLDDQNTYAFVQITHACIRIIIINVAIIIIRAYTQIIIKAPEILRITIQGQRNLCWCVCEAGAEAQNKIRLAVESRGGSGGELGALWAFLSCRGAGPAPV